MIRKGQWKITNYKEPFEVENFALFNLSEDIAEQHDLKEQEPEKYHELLKEWEKFSKEVKVQIPAPTMED
jgi:arylsulfatase